MPHRLTKAEAKRIAGAVRTELGRLRIARFFHEQGYSRQEIAAMEPKPRARETTAERAKRKGWSAGRAAVVTEAERAALAVVRGWYGKSK